jgi:light-harvesting complex 1 beta chain
MGVTLHDAQLESWFKDIEAPPLCVGVSTEMSWPSGCGCLSARAVRHFGRKAVLKGANMSNKASVSGLSDEEAQEFHRYWMQGAVGFTAVAVLAHILRFGRGDPGSELRYFFIRLKGKLHAKTHRHSTLCSHLRLNHMRTGPSSWWALRFCLCWFFWAPFLAFIGEIICPVLKEMQRA